MLREGALVHAGRQALDTDADAVQRQVSGVVRLKLFDGACTVGDVTGVARRKTIVLAKRRD